MRSRWPSGLRVSSAMSSPFSLRAASVIGMRARGRMARSRSASMAATSTLGTATESKAGWFELIVGKSVPTDGAAKCFGFVTSYDTKPKRRLAELLKAQGLQMNQAITFLSDGGDTVRDLQLYLSPLAEHLLDWFHITMRITVLRQQLKELIASAPGGRACPVAAGRPGRGGAGELQTRQERGGVPRLDHGERDVHSELRRPLSVRRGDLDRVCRVDGEGGDQQAVCQETADALDEEGRPSPVAGASSGV